MHGPIVNLPNNECMASNEGGYLPFPGLSNKARTANIYNNLQSASLISVGQLCDNGCIVAFDNQAVYAIKNGNIILQGYRNNYDGL